MPTAGYRLPASVARSLRSPPAMTSPPFTGLPFRDRHRRLALSAPRHRSFLYYRPMQIAPSLAPATRTPPPSNPSSSSTERCALSRAQPVVPLSPAHRRPEASQPGPMPRSITARSARTTVARSDHCSSIRPRTLQIPASRCVFGRMANSGSLPVVSDPTSAKLTGPGAEILAPPKKISTDSPGRPIFALLNPPDHDRRCRETLPWSLNMLRLPRGSCYAAFMRPRKPRLVEVTSAHLCKLSLAGANCSRPSGPCRLNDVTPIQRFCLPHHAVAAGRERQSASGSASQEPTSGNRPPW